jgi:aryl-alcohol dehydrogenase-like predicted oxidoreductase
MQNMDAKVGKRPLGNSGLEVSALGMGCMNLGSGTGKAADIYMMA